jgi:hypothetical protein
VSCDHRIFDAVAFYGILNVAEFLFVIGFGRVNADEWSSLFRGMRRRIFKRRQRVAAVVAAERPEIH